MVRQPHGEEERTSALQALLACPTASIHTEKTPVDIKCAQDTIPIRVPCGDDGSGGDGSGDDDGEGGVFHLAYHSEQSYGAAPYLIRLPLRGRQGRTPSPHAV